MTWQLAQLARGNSSVVTGSAYMLMKGDCIASDSGEGTDMSLRYGEKARSWLPIEDRSGASSAMFYMMPAVKNKGNASGPIEAAQSLSSASRCWP